MTAIGPITGGGLAKLLLAYRPSADIANGVALTADVWANLCADQSFTVAPDGSRLCSISAAGGVYIANGSAFSFYAESRLNIDNGTLYLYASQSGTPLYSSGLATRNPLNGGAPLTLLLAAGAHTVRVEVLAQYNSTLYCRPTTIPTREFFDLRVVQLP